MNRPVSKVRAKSPRFSQGHPLWRTHYQTAAASVDVTDLLNSDFELIQLVERAVIHLGVQSTLTSAEERLNYAEQVLTLVLDLQTDRVITLIGRLTGWISANSSESAPIASLPANGNEIRTEAERALRARCAELNRLDGLAQPCDYAVLRTGGRDRFSGMRTGQLVGIIPPAVWAEMQIRLRAAGILTPTMELKVARWIARGLDVSQAIEKVKWDLGPGRHQTSR